ncbi:GNAT family N-acetyltransferase [Ornithinimicrobium sp. LYQ92]|uniref:GNAT family N-acetyltransferase n=1 Tax=Serinicoccus sp. LYQ92 TaxID=3378798 RepID=UPI003852C94F
MVELVEGAAVAEAVWRTCYREVLAPAFPAEELVSEEAFLGARHRQPSGVVLALDEGEPVGVSMVDGAGGAAPVALLSYLASRASRRAQGVGSMLMERARTTGPMLLIEIEDPHRHDDRGFGDPWRRVAFYRRHGVRALDVPFFQPPVAAGRPRVEGMLLGVLTPGPVPDSVDAAPVRDFLTGYLLGSGEDLDDAPARELLAALAGPRVQVVDLPHPG